MYLSGRITAQKTAYDYTFHLLSSKGRYKCWFEVSKRRLYRAPFHAQHSITVTVVMYHMT